MTDASKVWMPDTFFRLKEMKSGENLNSENHLLKTVEYLICLWSVLNKVLEIMEVDILYYYIDENFHFQKWKDREVPRDIDSKSLHQGVSQRWCPLQYKVDTVFMIFTEISEENPFRRVWHISSLIKCFLPNLSTKLVLLM